MSPARQPLIYFLNYHCSILFYLYETIYLLFDAYADNR
jgi:hypothetical protein